MAYIAHLTSLYAPHDEKDDADSMRMWHIEPFAAGSDRMYVVQVVKVNPNLSDMI